MNSKIGGWIDVDRGGWIDRCVRSWMDGWMDRVCKAMDGQMDMYGDR